MAGAEPLRLVVAAEKGQLGVTLSVEDGARHPLVPAGSVNLRVKPPGKRPGPANREPPDTALPFDKIRVYPEVLEQHLGASLQGLPIPAVDADLAAGDRALGREEPQQPRHILVHPHARALWQSHQRYPVAHRQVPGRHGDVPIWPRHHDRVVAGDLDDATAADEPHDAVAGTKGMTRQVD